eukprot:13970132-Alexandrium_andersonii.AAC.1
MGACVPVCGAGPRLTANGLRHAVAQQFPFLIWSDLGVWHGGAHLDYPPAGGPGGPGHGQGLRPGVRGRRLAVIDGRPPFGGGGGGSGACLLHWCRLSCLVFVPEPVPGQQLHCTCPVAHVTET